MDEVQLNGQPFSILTLDGGGSRGAFTLGALAEIEAQLGKKLSVHFELMYGTSTGAIIATYLATGYTAKQTFERYMEFIPRVMSCRTTNGRTAALEDVAKEEFGECEFSDARCMLAIVATRTDHRRPLIFKSNAELAQGRKATFVPGFGVPLHECLLASSAAAPFFEKRKLTIDDVEVEVIDGGFVANNPSMFALIDAERALSIKRQDIRLCAIGTGDFPVKKHWWDFAKSVWPIQLLEATLESNSNTVEILRKLTFEDVSTVRVNGVYRDTSLATDLLESDPKMLRKLFELGREAFGTQEQALAKLFGVNHG
ncbi:patatin-like phospholipase family protein [Thioalbus denitrificans]|uniref:Patatin-like phospholipase/acyl hydrolase n=1 Tax=Thioalbus denitrificans TaxID=547122 RepID=A0A369CK37_9GAMM|nr:patatin-like phospholipase family protein [Thioalbus denitrificans]RCX32807.1 patatin-like phospholipase/acyl hydrolase [Thioalbus denitrificans]